MQSRTLKLALIFACAALLASQAAFATDLNPTGALDRTNLGDFLRSAGYVAQPKANGAYWLSVPLLGNSALVSVSTSKDGTRVWLTASVAHLADLNGIPAETFSRLLMASQNHGPAHFSIERCDSCAAGDRYLVWFHDSLENRGITTASFRELLAKLTDSLTKTADLWDEKNWKPTASVRR